MTWPLAFAFAIVGVVWALAWMIVSITKEAPK